MSVSRANRRSVFIDDAAMVLGVSRRTVYNRIREGRLATLRTRGGSQRVLVESIDALLMQRRERLVGPATENCAASLCGSPTSLRL